jgi:hypothetical protein
MNKNNPFLIRLTGVLAVTAGLVSAHAQNLVGNGDFSLDPIGQTSFALNAVNATAFSYWRLYSVNSTNGSNIRGTIVTNPASAGNLAMQLEYNRIGARNLAGGEDSPAQRQVQAGAPKAISYQ